MAFSKDRYEHMIYRRAGHSGLRLPAISLGMWHNFGAKADTENCRVMMRTAFDLGITHFDLANGYGPPAGAAEEQAGRILKKDFAGHRDELVISTKAGYPNWPGPYGDWGSRKHMLASLDRSLKRLQLEYVDIYYHHRADVETPLEETLGALDTAVRQGKALYTGISSYSSARFAEAQEATLKRRLAPIALYQPLYNMLDRSIEKDHLGCAAHYGTGVICFCPLAQGLLTSKYLDPDELIPGDSRAADPDGALTPEAITEAKLSRVRRLSEIARERGQTMAQMALAWILKDERITSALIGASKPGQIADCAGAVKNISFTPEELARIDEICLK